jgi:hypothetical protein
MDSQLKPTACFATFHWQHAKNMGNHSKDSVANAKIKQTFKLQILNYEKVN